MSLVYKTGGRYYRIKKNKENGKTYGDVSRISCAEYDNYTTNPNIGKIKPKNGDKVIIITKPYHLYNCITGIVKDVLTRRETHTRGHKVRIISDNKMHIGRVLKILN